MKKQQMEIILIILLIALMYLQSSLLNTFSKSVLGKGSMIFAIIYITQKFGRNAGILSALIMVLNLYNAEKNLTEGALLAQDLGGQEGFREYQSKQGDAKQADTKQPDAKQDNAKQGGAKQAEPTPSNPEQAKGTKTTSAKNLQNAEKVQKRAQELAQKAPAGDLQAYVEEADGDGIPDPETWMSPESLKKFKAYVKKIKKKRDAEVTSGQIAEDVEDEEDEDKKIQENFINMMLRPKSIQGIDRQLKKVAEYNKMAVTSQGNEFVGGKFGFVKRPF